MKYLTKIHVQIYFLKYILEYIYSKFEHFNVIFLTDYKIYKKGPIYVRENNMI